MTPYKHLKKPDATIKDGYGRCLRMMGRVAGRETQVHSFIQTPRQTA